MRTTGRVVLDPRQSSLDPGAQLTGTLTRFGYDTAEGMVVVRYDGALSTAGGTRVETRRFEASVPADGTAATVGPALNAAANQVADRGRQVDRRLAHCVIPAQAGVSGPLSQALRRLLEHILADTPGAATIRSSSARISAARPASNRRQRPSGGTSRAATCGLIASAAMIMSASKR